MSGINQKEYLKKYLGIGKDSGEKKKKKKSKKLGKGLKIVDDDIDVNLNEEIQVDLAADNEEAPQIVSIIDDRPPSLRIDEETHSSLWKPIGVSDMTINTEKNLKFKGSITLPKKLDSKSKREYLPKSSMKKETSSQDRSSEKSSNRKIKHEQSGEDFSPVRNSKSNDFSSMRKSQSSDGSSVRRMRADSDCSPPRKSISQKDRDISPLRKKFKEGSDDVSPLRKRKEEDFSPPRRKKRDSDSSSLQKSKIQEEQDNSPPRRRIKEENDRDISPPRNKIRSKDSSPPRQRHRGDSDSSPIRQRHRRDSSDSSSPSKSRVQKDEDNSPPRRRIKKENYGDMSPPRNKIHLEDLSPPRKRTENEARKIKSEEGDDNSPPRKRKESLQTRKKSRWGESEESAEKLQKTLDGKTAGLQNAAELVRETEELKKREDELFKKLSSEVSGANAATIVRNKKRDDVDPEEEERKRKSEEENIKKYDRWGRGLKQVEDINERIKNDLHEMSKPLARYANDEDLERHLKEQEREGDPMLAYIRQKKRKKAVEGGVPVIQQYEGDAPPNRFGIRPGYRWDGVNRSNGYEQKWFEVQNSRTASLEESYKWSTEDM